MFLQTSQPFNSTRVGMKVFDIMWAAKLLVLPPLPEEAATVLAALPLWMRFRPTIFSLNRSTCECNVSYLFASLIAHISEYDARPQQPHPFWNRAPRSSLPSSSQTLSTESAPLLPSMSFYLQEKWRSPVPRCSTIRLSLSTKRCSLSSASFIISDSISFVALLAASSAQEASISFAT